MSHPLPQPPPRQIDVLFSARTDVGRSREHNEDNFLVDRRLRLYIVCDGLGGHHGGEIASATAVNVVREHVREHRELLEMFDGDEQERPEVLLLLEAAVKLANERIHERGRLAQTARGMGTTLSLLLVVGSRGYTAHVGDTRIYRLRDGAFSQITEDHSLLTEMQRGLHVSAETMQAVGDRIKNQVTRAVGVNPTVDVDVGSVDLRDGDRFLLASDGLHGPVPDDILASVLADPSLDAVTSRCIDLANAAGGPDNITAVVLEIETSDAEPADPSLTLARQAFALARGQAIFRGFADGDLARILDGVERVSLPPGAVLVDHDNSVSGLHILLSGELVIQDLRNAGATPVVLKPGALIFEEALLAERLAPCRITAMRHGQASLAHVPRAIFLSHAVQKPLLLVKVAQAIAISGARRLDHAVATTGSLPFYLPDPDASGDPSTRPTDRASGLNAAPPTGIGLRPGQQRAAVSSKPPGTVPPPPPGATAPALPSAQDGRSRQGERSASDTRHLTLPAIPSIKSPSLAPPLPPPLPPGRERRDD